MCPVFLGEMQETCRVGSGLTHYRRVNGLGHDTQADLIFGCVLEERDEIETNNSFTAEPF
jgi:hypothetical protein